MAVSSEQVTVDTTPTLLSADRGTPGRETLLVRCVDADVYLGGPDVDASSGFLLPQNETLTIELRERGSFPSESLFAVVAAATATVFVLRQGV